MTSIWLFFYHKGDFDTMWKIVKRKMSNMSYVCVQHGPHKYRVSPNKPAAWSIYQELYRELKEANEGLNRGELSKEASRRMREGAHPKQPHGCNCIDIETHRISPGRPVKLMGSQCIETPLHDIFPTAVGVFGPLQFAIPKKPSMLLKEYGADCLVTRKATLKDKQHRKVSLMEVPPGFRRTTWPAVPLQNAKDYLS